jgi:hypothetical protein
MTMKPIQTIRMISQHMSHSTIPSAESASRWISAESPPTLAAFQLIQPATNVFGVDGKQRNRGRKFSVLGEVIEGLRLLDGTSYIELTKTQGGVNQATKAPVFPFQARFLYGEWNLPFS